MHDAFYPAPAMPNPSSTAAIKRRSLAVSVTCPTTEAELRNFCAHSCAVTHQGPAFKLALLVNGHDMSKPNTGHPKHFNHAYEVRYMTAQNVTTRGGVASQEAVHRAHFVTPDPYMLEPERPLSALCWLRCAGRSQAMSSYPPPSFNFLAWLRGAHHVTPTVSRLD